MRAIHLILLLVGFLLAGCMVTPPRGMTATTQKEAEVRELLLGRWQQELLDGNGRVQPTSDIEYEFFPDGRFAYRLGFLGSPDRREFIGRWEIDGSVLVQHWPQIANNAPQTTRDTILHISRGQLRLYTHLALFYTCRRLPPA